MQMSPSTRHLSPFDALKPLAGRALETALNHALALDPDTEAALRPLEGRRIQVAVDAPSLAMDIMVGGGRLQVGPASEVLEADLAKACSVAIRLAASEAGWRGGVVCLDGLPLDDADFLDVGQAQEEGAIPVVLRRVLFAGDGCAPRPEGVS